MVDTKRWSICRPPAINPSIHTAYRQQAYINLGNGIGIYDVVDFNKQFPELTQRYILHNQYNHFKQDPYARAVSEQPSDAYVLYVPAGVRHEHCIMLPTRLSKQILSYRIYIIIGCNAQITLQHDQWGSAQHHITMHLESSAQLTFMQSNKHAQEQYTYIACYQQQRSKLNLHGWYMHAAYTHMQFYVQEQYAQAEIKLGIESHAAMHSWFKTAQTHQASDTQSSLLLKGLLHDVARSSHMGMIHIDEGVHRIEADLQSHYLLLSNQAQAYTLPSLEVLSEDVQCAHGSAIGSFDEEQLFYMMSRGLSAAQGQRVLAQAFFNGLWQTA